MHPGLDALDASLPGTLPVFPGLTVTGRYVLSSRSEGHSGDCLKAVALPDGKVALAVVDAMGHGAIASTASVRLLAVLRGSLESGTTAEEAMAVVDRYASRSTVAQGASMAVAVVDQHDGSMEVASAGHPAPILLDPGGARLLALAPSRPLGLGGTASHLRSRLATGESLLLHTNGLLTARDGRITDATARLLEVIGDWLRTQSHTQTPAQRGDHLCAQMLAEMQKPDGFTDDVAMLLVEHTDRPLAFSYAARAVPDALPQVRSSFGEWLDSVGVGLLDHVALSRATDELTANVVQHAYVDDPGPEEVHVEAELDDGGVLHVHVHDSGHWHPRANAGSGRGGRGLVRAGGLVDSMHLTRGADGTEVILEQAIGRPVPLLRSGRDSREPVVESPLTLDESPRRLNVGGVVGEEDSEALRHALHEVTLAGTRDATVDLSAVTRLSGTAVRVLFDYRDRALGSGAELTVTAEAGSPAQQVLSQADLPHAYDA